MFFLAGIGAGALGHAGFRSLQEEGRVEMLWGRFEEWRRNRRCGEWRRGGGLRGGQNRYQALRYPQSNPGWRVVSTHSPTLLTQLGAGTGQERPLPDITISTYGDELSPTNSDNGGWLQL